MAPPARLHASAVKHVNSGGQELSVEPTTHTYDAKILQIGQLGINPKTDPAIRHIWDYYDLNEQGMVLTRLSKIGLDSWIIFFPLYISPSTCPVWILFRIDPLLLDPLGELTAK